MYPGAMLPDVDDLQEIGIEPGAGQHPSEGQLVHFGRAGGNHHPVEVICRNILQHLLLTGFRTAVELMPTDCHVRQFLA